MPNNYRTPLIGDVYKQNREKGDGLSYIVMLVGIIDGLYLLGDNTGYTKSDLNDPEKWTLLKEGAAV